MTNRMQAEFNETIKNLITTDEPLVLGISGGVDSMVLLDLLMHSPLQNKLILSHVNHHLRSESETEALEISKIADRLDLPFFKEDFFATKSTGTEDEARQFRYKTWEKLMVDQDAKYLLTAHHANDQMETVLMKLARSGSILSVAGIRPTRKFGKGSLIRPLLNFSKVDIRKYAKDREVIFFEDETNKHDDYLRNRIRHHIIPGLYAENGEVLAHNTRFTIEMQELIAEVEQNVKEWFENKQIKDHILVNDLAKMTKIKQQLVIQLLAKKQGISLFLTDKHMSQIRQIIENTTKPNQRLALDEKISLIKTYNKLFLTQDSNLENDQFDETINGPGSYELGNGKTVIIEASNTQSGVPIIFPVKIRNFHAGDRVKKGDHSIKLSRWFINQKVPQYLRTKLLVFEDANGQIVGVEDLGYAKLSCHMETGTINYVIKILK